MKLPCSKASIRQSFKSFSKHLKAVFAEMDRAYQVAAQYYAFSCDGCKDNCCRSRFYHHTFLEYAYLLEDFTELDGGNKSKLYMTARNACQMTGGANSGNKDSRPMCPLNSAGRCILYAYRPMICRLHGIPHEFSPPGKELIKGLGCRTFYDRCGQEKYYSFDRTSFYTQLAELEKEFKQQAGIQFKLKMTVAEIFCTFEDEIY